MTDPQNAPVFLNLFRIRFPAGAIASIAHRISGILLFLSLPLLAWLLGKPARSSLSGFGFRVFACCFIQ